VPSRMASDIAGWFASPPRKSVPSWPRSAIKHQDRWAGELYELREQLRTRQGTLATGVTHDVYRRVHQELLQVRGELERLKRETGRA
jgi:hypothetical protein